MTDELERADLDAHVADEPGDQQLRGSSSPMLLTQPLQIFAGHALARPTVDTGLATQPRTDSFPLRQTTASQAAVGVGYSCKRSSTSRAQRRLTFSSIFFGTVRIPTQKYEVSNLGRLTRHSRDSLKKSTIGDEYARTALDDPTRLAYSEVQEVHTCGTLLHLALAWFAAHGITVRRALTAITPRHIGRAPTGMGLCDVAAQTPLR